MLTKTIEKTKDAALKSYLVTTYTLFGAVIYKRTIDFCLMAEYPDKF